MSRLGFVFEAFIMPGY